MSVTPKEALFFHEAERHHVVLTHADFARDDNFEFLEESDDLNDFLLSKPWDKYFVVLKNGSTTCDVVIINKVFEECYLYFGKKMDTVQLFHIITAFYALDATVVFNKLVQLHRKRLVHDLELRIGKIRTGHTKTIGDDRVQLAFNLIFNKK